MKYFNTFEGLSLDKEENVIYDSIKEGGTILKTTIRNGIAAAWGAIKSGGGKRFWDVNYEPINVKAYTYSKVPKFIEENVISEKVLNIENTQKVDDHFIITLQGYGSFVAGDVVQLTNSDGKGPALKILSVSDKKPYWRNILKVSNVDLETKDTIRSLNGFRSVQFAKELPISWNDSVVSLIENDNAEWNGKVKLLNLLKNPNLHKGLVLNRKNRKNTEVYDFPREEYISLLRNAAKVCFETAKMHFKGEEPDGILLVSSGSQMVNLFAQEVSKVFAENGIKLKVEEKFFTKKHALSVNYERLVDELIDDEEQRKQIKDEIVEELWKMAETEDPEFKAKKLRKTLGKFISKAFEINPDLDIKRVEDALSGKNYIVLDDVTSSTQTTFNNVAQVLSEKKVDNAMFYAVVRS